MLNKEKYAKEILDIACNGNSVSMRNGVLCSCDTINDCAYCDFYNKEISCGITIKEWANSEYKEPEIDWSKVPVDTPLVIATSDGKVIYRHFAFIHFDLEDVICVYENGRTSFSDNNEDNIECYLKDNVTIKKGVDCSEWYKD